MNKRIIEISNKREDINLMTIITDMIVFTNVRLNSIS